MKLLVVGALVGFILTTGCSSHAESKFDRGAWRAAGNSCEDGNPRRAMADDLMRRHLSVGMRRREIQALLGRPQVAIASSPYRTGWEWHFILGRGEACEGLELEISRGGHLVKWSRYVRN